MTTKAKKDFSTLSPDEIAALTGKEKQAYEKWLNDLTNASADATEDKTPASSKPASSKSSKSKEVEEEEENEGFNHEVADKIARKYWKEHKQCDQTTLVIVSDGAVFYGSEKGKNAALNHVNANKALGLSSITIER